VIAGAEQTRWFPLDPVGEQLRLLESTARFAVVAAGRRSGKTERAKRRLVHKAAMSQLPGGGNFVACAPTRDQAKRIFWDDLVELAKTYPGGERGWIVDHVAISELTIHLHNGSRIMVVGLDKPHRLEGIPIDGAVLDEYAECKPQAWTQTLRPALSTRDRPGWCWFTGRPKGRNHFYELFRDASTREDWDAFHWHSAEVLPEAEIESAKRDLDELMFRQEYEADFVNFEGLAYYCFDPSKHLRELAYDPQLPLVFCFDFNVDPGVAVVVQDQPKHQATCVIGEVYIRRNSTTPAVCRKLVDDWQHHRGPVELYGDATGASRRTSATEGSDWELIRQHLRGTFADLRNRVARSNPRERDRVNSVNARLLSAAGDVGLLVDPSKAPNVVRDLEGVTILPGSAGELDKRTNPELTHLTDALGYFIHAKHPLGGYWTAMS
jgi:hypothetical protein